MTSLFTTKASTNKSYETLSKENFGSNLRFKLQQPYKTKTKRQIYINCRQVLSPIVDKCVRDAWYMNNPSQGVVMSRRLLAVPIVSPCTATIDRFHNGRQII
jgi:hypothetical protein